MECRLQPIANLADAFVGVRVVQVVENGLQQLLAVVRFTEKTSIDCLHQGRSTGQRNAGRCCEDDVKGILQRDLSNRRIWIGDHEPREHRDPFVARHDQNRAAFVLRLCPPDLSLCRQAHQGSSAIICVVASSAHPTSACVWGTRV